MRVSEVGLERSERAAKVAAAALAEVGYAATVDLEPAGFNVFDVREHWDRRLVYNAYRIGCMSIGLEPEPFDVWNLRICRRNGWAHPDLERHNHVHEDVTP
jgi:hypothetical protein